VAICLPRKLSNNDVIKALGSIRMLMLQINLSVTLEGKEELNRKLKVMLKTLPAGQL
jgi:hypothetical protein